MIEYYKKHTSGESFHKLRRSTDDMWIHIGAPSVEELDALAEAYELDRDTIRDVLDKNELAHSEFKQSTEYVFLRPAMRTRNGEVKTRPLLAILRPDVFITIATSMAVTAQDIAMYGDKHRVITSQRSRMLIATIYTIIGGYEQLLQRTDEYITSIQKKLRTHEVDNRDFVHFVTIEGNLNEYHTCLRDMLVVMERLCENKHDVFNDHESEEVKDIILYIRQLMSAVDRMTQTINSIRNAYSTIANNTLNERMKLLTALTVLIALPNVFYGMYGMNVPLPYQDTPLAYPTIVLFTILVISLVYAIAKRFKVF
ncbi:MAG: magnesium transporter CorA family protein [Candidatus Saccharimonadales bacterium]